MYVCMYVCIHIYYEYMYMYIYIYIYIYSLNSRQSTEIVLSAGCVYCNTSCCNRTASKLTFRNLFAETHCDRIASKFTNSQATYAPTAGEMGWAAISALSLMWASFGKPLYLRLGLTTSLLRVDLYPSSDDTSSRSPCSLSRDLEPGPGIWRSLLLYVLVLLSDSLWQGWGLHGFPAPAVCLPASSDFGSGLGPLEDLLQTPPRALLMPLAAPFSSFLLLSTPLSRTFLDRCLLLSYTLHSSVFTASITSQLLVDLFRVGLFSPQVSAILCKCCRIFGLVKSARLSTNWASSEQHVGPISLPGKLLEHELVLL